MNAFSNIVAASYLSLTVDRKSLANALGAMRATGAGIIEKRNTIPILGCVLLDMTPDCLTVRGTDLDCMLSVQLPAAGDRGQLAVDFFALEKAVKGGTGEHVRIFDNGAGRAILTTDAGTTSLPALPAADFPMQTFLTFDRSLLFTVDAETLRHDLDRVAPCISTEETRYYLNGVFFHATRIAPPQPRTAEHEAADNERRDLADAQYESQRRARLLAGVDNGAVPEGEPDDAETVAARRARIDELDALIAAWDAVRCVPDKLCMAATDGHRLGRIARDVPDGMPAALPDTIVPRKAIEWLRRKGLKSAGATGTARIGFDKGSRFACIVGRMEFVTKAIDGSFPDYSRVIPHGVSKRVITVGAEALADAAKSVSAHMSGRTRSFLLSAGNGWGTAYGQCPDNGVATAVIDGATFKAEASFGDDYCAGFNAKYVRDLMGSFAGETVTIGMEDCAAPARIEGDASPEFLAVLMPMRVDIGTGGPFTPDCIRKMTRTPLDIFHEDMPGKLEGIAKAAIVMANRAVFSKADAAKGIGRLRAEAGAMVTAAIDFRATREGRGRFEARDWFLRLLATMKGERPRDAIERARLARVRANVRAAAMGQPVDVQPVDVQAAELQAAESYGPPAPFADVEFKNAPAAPAEPAAPRQPDAPAEDSPDAPEQADEPSAAAVAADIRARQPMFATLQAFKAAAGQGSRWIIDNYAPDSGWGGARVRTVATVRARDVGFLGENATLAECQAADVRGFRERSWIGFPKQPDWTSDPEGLVIYYPACSQSGRAAKEIPCIRLRPAPAVEAVVVPVVDAAIEAVPAGQAGDMPTGAATHVGEIAELRALVIDLAAKVAAMEAAGKPLEAAGDSPAPDVGVEASETPVRRSQAHERAIRRAWTYRNRIRAYRSEQENARVHMGNVVKRTVRAEAETVEAERQRDLAIDEAKNARELLASVSETKAEMGRAARIGIVRARRMSAVLAGRKRQIAALGRDLLTARNRTADMRAAGGTPRALESVPAIPAPDVGQVRSIHRHAPAKAPVLQRRGNRYVAV